MRNGSEMFKRGARAVCSSGWAAGLASLGALAAEAILESAVESESDRSSGPRRTLGRSSRDFGRRESARDSAGTDGKPPRSDRRLYGRGDRRDPGLDPRHRNHRLTRRCGRVDNDLAVPSITSKRLPTMTRSSPAGDSRPDRHDRKRYFQAGIHEDTQEEARQEGEDR